MGVVIYSILILVSIVLHELGHFVAAKYFGIRVTRFCVFFDWGFHLLSTGKRFATEYRLGWLPLGGYVKFDNGEGGEQPKWSFTAQQPWKRFVVYLAGVTVNLLVAYTCLFFCVRSVLPSKYFPSTFVMARLNVWWVKSKRLSAILSSVISQTPLLTASRQALPNQRRDGMKLLWHTFHQHSNLSFTPFGT